MAFLDLDDVKAQLRIPLSNTTDDVALQAVCDAVTIIVERHTGITIDTESFTEELYIDSWTNKFRLINTPLTNLVSVTDVENGSIDTTGAIVRASGLVILKSRIRADTYLDVVYSAGLDDNSVPQNYTQAGLIIAQQMWETRRGGMPSTAATLDESLSKESYRQGFLVGYVIPNRALELLGPKPPLVM